MRWLVLLENEYGVLVLGGMGEKELIITVERPKV